MKHRNTNVATVVLWQGKDGEPGLDVSNAYNEHLPIIIDADGLHHNNSKNTSYCFCTHRYAYNKNCYAYKQPHKIHQECLHKINIKGEK